MQRARARQLAVLRLRHAHGHAAARRACDLLLASVRVALSRTSVTVR